MQISLFNELFRGRKDRRGLFVGIGGKGISSEGGLGATKEGEGKMEEELLVGGVRRGG